MFKIISIMEQNKAINLSEDKDNSHNTFTVITGKNACGKSSLLGKIVNSFIFQGESKRMNLAESSVSQPKKVIAVSTSRFDKFPTIENAKNNIKFTDSYNYLGFSGKHSSPSDILSDGFLSIIKGIMHDDKNTSRIGDVFNYLGFNQNISVNFDIKVNVGYLHTKEYNNYARKYITSIDNKLYNHNEMRDYINFSKWFNQTFLEDYIARDSDIKHHFLNQKDTYQSNVDRLSFLKYIENTTNNFGGKNFNIKFDLYDKDSIDKADYEWLIYLMSKGAVKVKNINLTNKNEKTSFSFNQASSGQQCIMTMMIGIAGSIDDNSLICIDEPEISLHPQWQLDFIKLLQKTFNHYNGCHFIIATHSPQIVSGLEQRNGYICSLEKNQLHDAITTSKKSADFQLAEIFNSPGYKNEYLLRVLLSFLTNPHEFSNTSVNSLSEIERIINQKENITPTDPVYKLICLAENVLLEGKNVLNLQ
ncbi:AAA family ATPase [Yokenella regensburgei]|uniref:AAA family ATPase n=1 Tax=Yokenella regensburgei TaxID=158877 RepID=UPI000241FE0F|nr:ATP-binding protein [Yokenella regensburgei]EHM49912.1 hypothetical protein HMPREF0880_01429 [Yokenella regensburgei ATCC 43003]